jgi:hypothetical protein
VQQTARGALDRLCRELRMGSSVTAASASSVTFNFVDSTLHPLPSTSTNSWMVPSGSLSPTLIVMVSPW